MILRSNGRILGCDGIKGSNRILPKETREEARAATTSIPLPGIQRELEGDAVGGELLAASSVRAIMHRNTYVRCLLNPPCSLALLLLSTLSFRVRQIAGGSVVSLCELFGIKKCLVLV
jgi:hypothetical protein